jgi:hypothetical protein
MTRRWLLAVWVLEAACVRYPEPYRPPMQRKPVEIARTGKLSHFIAMNSPDAARHILDGVLDLNDGTWRWCMKQAVFQFELPTTSHKRLLAEITVPELTFSQTGPVKITVRVGTHVLERLEFAKHEQRYFEKPVPAEWLTPDTPLLVSLEIDKVWRSPDDGVERGFILTRIGFIE